MRKARATLAFDPAAPVVRSHCHSGFNGPWAGFDEAEREEFLQSIYLCADFAGIQIVAFSIRATAFDLIVDMRRNLEIPREEMLRRLESVTDPLHFQTLRQPLDAGDEAAWSRLADRFGDVGVFIKQLKQLATSRYHRRHGTRGTLWNGRYASAYVQTGHVSRVLAAWIDHAALRSGETADVEKERFNTFGRAVAGEGRARAMIGELFAPEADARSWREIAGIYRKFIADESIPPGAKRSNLSVPLLTRKQLLLTEVPQFRGGLAIGDEAFTEAFFQLNRHDFGPRRKRGGHPVGGQYDRDLWTIRQKTDLRRI